MLLGGCSLRSCRLGAGFGGPHCGVSASTGGAAGDVHARGGRPRRTRTGSSLIRCHRNTCCMLMRRVR